MAYLFGTPEVHLSELERAAKRGRRLVHWTINALAKPNDRALFYMIRPLSAFVAWGTVRSKASLAAGKRYGWPGHHMSVISDIKMLPRYVPLNELRRCLPEWGFLKQPRHSITVPDALVGKLEWCLNELTRGPAEASDIEGIKTETVRFMRGRSRRLRDLALKTARGVCCVCETDFSKVLGGDGVRVLQVHHRRQLAASDVPRVTRLEDLAVVCANCHMLIHMDPKHALSVEGLKKRLKEHNT